MIILGAGLSGLIAAAVNPQAKVFEAASRDAQSHRAVLRFRSSGVGDAVGVPFRKIRVNKGIWWRGGFNAPNIQLSNLYSYKVTGGYYDRSIWSVDSVDRYIAPEDFILQLIDQVGDRVEWDTPVVELPKTRPIVSTIPMSRLLKLVPTAYTWALSAVEFKFSPIKVQRFRLKGSDVFQTIYYPDHSTSVYRASITGNLLIVESIADGVPNMEDVFESFGFTGEVDPIDLEHKQSYGKIAPIDEDTRRWVIETLSQKEEIYSLGRFATWRNILLDDVLKDLQVIKKLMNADLYSRKIHSLQV